MIDKWEGLGGAMPGNGHASPRVNAEFSSIYLLIN